MTVNTPSQRPPDPEELEGILPSHPRSAARQLAMQLLYQLDVQRGENLDQVERFLLEHARDAKTRSLAAQWSREAWRNIAALDEHIRQTATNWNLMRISAVDRAILRLSVYHLLYCPDIPPKVVINEGLELAKRFSTAQAPGFINGVLDAMRRRLHPDAAGGEPEVQSTD